jgi:geranylgeranyl pyrophosphate synthase
MLVDIRLTAAHGMQHSLKKILEPLNDHLILVEKEIKKRMTSGIPIIDQSAMHLFSSGGKRIRAALVILASGLNNRIPDGIIELAAATEIVHAASLIHDDIIDQSMIRRGNITVPQKWGYKVSVLVGDFMYSTALNIALQDGNPAIFPLIVAGTKDMVMGELYQIQYSEIENVNRQHYLSIVELKTARFMGTCAKIGGTKADMALEVCAELYTFGLNLGYAFQIIDDTFDVIQNSSDIGKDVGSDFKDGKITLPFIYLIEQGDKNDLLMLKRYSSNPNTSDWMMIKKRLVDSGAIDHAINFAGAYIDKALSIMKKFPESQFRNILLKLSDFLLNRKY